MPERQGLNSREKEMLLKLARAEVCQRLGLDGPGLPGEFPASLQGRQGAFVTLHKRGALRGCIGNFTSDLPLYRTIREMARAAAFQDPRFAPLAAGEMPEIDFEISVLSPLRRIEDVGEITVGVHGIYLISPRGRGVLLPQVATEYGWGREMFLRQTCRKAGLEDDCWKQDDVEVLIFSAQVFGENEPL